MIDQWAEQIERARALGAEQGTAGLWRHAMVGRMCGCHDCFCCAAMQVRDEMAEDVRALRLAVQRAEMDLRRFEWAGASFNEEAEAVRRQIRNTRERIAGLENGRPR
jgi:hypothetical protein